MKKSHFFMTIECRNCNPNGDPLNGNRPRMDSMGHALMTPVCLNHKVRVAAEQLGQRIYITTSDDDGYNCLNDRALGVCPNYQKEKKQDLVAANKKMTEQMNKAFWDCRLFGFLVPSANNSERRAVSIGMARTVDPVVVRDVQITKCVGLEAPKSVEKKKANGDGEGEYGTTRSSDTMGSFSVVEFGLMVVHGEVCPELAAKYGVTEKDIEALKESLLRMFEFDNSLVRPAGSMLVRNLFWLEEDGTRRVSDAKTHDAFHVMLKTGVAEARKYQDYDVWVDKVPGITCVDLANE
ncbi:CRISPR-associated protein [Candidatus Allofournierella merdipullorum]|uniref:CRISPR-associated protein n=1 Tax=Candidatus Allofournierella merdipullorum TaxID=2838595 RepID=UPI00374F716B